MNNRHGVSFEFVFPLTVFLVILGITLGFVFGLDYLLNYLDGQGMITDERQNIIRSISGLFSQ